MIVDANELVVNSRYWEGVHTQRNCTEMTEMNLIIISPSRSLNRTVPPSLGATLWTRDNNQSLL